MENPTSITKRLPVETGWSSRVDLRGMKQRFRETNFHDKTMERINQAIEILNEYDGQKLTARQLYYQFVSRGMIPNTPTSYKNITSMLTDARYAGLIDWHLIEDRGREPNIPSEWNDIASLVESALTAYRLPRWGGQDYYAELWVEKQALAGVLSPIARRYHVPLMVNKGYSSASAMFESAYRIIGRTSDGQAPIIMYLGDHDPSGEDMVRDIHDRLTEFGVEDLDVQKLALTIDQVKKFNPPPNPAKLTDSRAASYISKYGDHSWEVDALPPEELNRIITSAFDGIVDSDKMDEIMEQEENDKKRLREAVKGFK